MVKTVFAILVCLLILIGCSEKDSYNFDTDFTDDLMLHGGYIVNKALEEVDEIAIYKTKTYLDETLHTVPKVYKKFLVYKTNDKSIISEFILCAREYTHCSGCYQNRGRERYHVVLVDSKNDRAGYFLFVPCAKEKEEYGIIRRSGSDSLYSNKCLVELFHELEIQ